MRICPQCGTRFEGSIQFCPNDGSPTYEAQSEQEPQRDPLLGLVIDGRYRIETQIGEGGMGVVYLAVHTVLQKRLALKVLRGDGSRDAEVVQRFMQEAQAATSIGHQNIIDITDFGRLPDGAVYFVMEYLDGTSLSDLINTGGSVPTQQAVHIIQQIASSLEAAHQRGIVHRDLKPDNIFVIRQGGDPNFVKVLDFGVAKVGGAASKLTKTGMVFGTPHYMSPEQAAGQSVDQRTDIYALGVIMYEMFTGKVPFDADTFMGILSKHMFEVPARPTLNGAPLGALENVILKALEKNPDHRYLSMTELLADLATIAAGGTIHVGGRPGVAPPGNLADALEPSAVRELSAASSGGGGRGFVLLAVAALVLVLVGGSVGTAVFFLTDDDEGQAEAQAQAVDRTPLTATQPSDPTPPGPSVETPPPTTVAVPAVETAPAPAVRTIAISSDPSGAEVLLDGVMVGNTPVDLPRPEGSTQEVTLRMRGYRESTLQIGADSGDSLNLTLARESTGRHHGPAPPIVRGVPPVVTQPPRPPPRHGSSEVVDPWAQ